MIVQLGIDRLKNGFQIRKRRLAARTPIDQAFASVNQALVIQRHKHFTNGARESFIKGESFARPVAGRADSANLVEDDPAVLLLPLPHALDEFFAAEVVPGQAFLPKLFLDDDLSRDAGVIHSRQPQRVESLHAFTADDHIMHRIVQHVAHVQRAGDIWRRHHDNECRAVRMASARKYPFDSHHWYQRLSTS